MPTISLCMIVKNEEEYIEAALESVKTAVDEIIIIDTGSEDNTKSICSRYTDQIYETEWTDDFSEARNLSLKKASCEWILWLDADERLVIKDKKAFQKVLSVKSKAAYSVKLLHYMDFKEEEKKYYTSYHTRLFRRDAKFCFQGAIHERLTGNDGEDVPAESIGNSAEILHLGYGSKHQQEKSLRNLRISCNEKAKSQDNFWLDYYIAAELYRLGNITDSLNFINRSIMGFVTQGKIPPSLLYKLKYELLIFNGNMASVSEGLEKAIILYPDYVELHFYRGIALSRLSRYEEAVKEFTYCILLGEDNENYLIQYGSGSFLAFYHMGEAYLKSGKSEYALEAFRQAVLTNPIFPEAKKRIEELRI